MTTTTTPITLTLTQEQAIALNTFLWTASIPWSAVGPSTNRKAIEQSMTSIVSQLMPLIYCDDPSND